MTTRTGPVPDRALGEPARTPIEDDATQVTPTARRSRWSGWSDGSGGSGGLLVEATVIVGFALAVLALGYSYRVAQTPGTTSMAPFAPFWAGLLLWLAVACWTVFRAGSSPFQRSLVLLATGVLMATPKFLRNPDQPLFFDEIAHWGQTQYMERTGGIDRQNVVAILQDYPGLHAMTTALQQVTHLSTWHLATALLFVLRAVVPLLVRDIARSARVPDRAADLAGLVYVLNPGFLFFTGMYAYESFAIVFQITVLALALRVAISSRDRAAGTARLVLVAAAAATVTHHLTSLFMAGSVLLLALAALGRDSWVAAPGRRRLLLTGAAVLELVAVWTATNFATVWAYLGVFPQQAAEQFAKLLSRSDRAPGSDAGSRGVLQNTGLPGYETIFALLSVPLAVGLGAWGLWLLRSRRRSPVLRALAVLALFYPLSMPLVLTVSGAPGAHRSWPFSYQGLAVLIAAAVAGLAAAGAARTAVAARLRLGSRRLLATGLLAILLIGNCASENHDVLRFPGAFVLGTEGRAQSPELIDTAVWAGRNLGGTGTVISDYFTGGYVSAFGQSPVATGFPGWDLLFYDSFPKPATLRRIVPDGVGYLIVDRRLSTGIFRTGFYLDASEPEAGVRTKPIPAAALTKFEAYPWLEKVYASSHYDVYRFDMARWADAPTKPTGIGRLP